MFLSIFVFSGKKKGFCRVIHCKLSVTYDFSSDLLCKYLREKYSATVMDFFSLIIKVHSIVINSKIISR